MTINMWYCASITNQNMNFKPRWQMKMWHWYFNNKSWHDIETSTTKHDFTLGPWKEIMMWYWDLNDKSRCDISTSITDQDVILRPQGQIRTWYSDLVNKSGHGVRTSIINQDVRLGPRIRNEADASDDAIATTLCKRTLRQRSVLWCNCASDLPTAKPSWTSIEREQE